MAKDKFEIRIVKDEGNKDLHLASMSIAAAKSLTVFIQSLTKIAELQENSKDIKISVTKGSAKVALEAPAKKIAVIEQQLKDVADNKSKNKILVNSWKNIQQTISANGLQYEAIFSKGGRNESVIDVLKQKKYFQIKRKARKKPDYSLNFYTGRLYDVGGKKVSNIHIELKEDLNLTIGCSENDIREIVKYIYTNVTVALWESKKETGKYQFCDYYSNEDEASKYKDLSARMLQIDGSVKQKEVYNIIDNCLHDNKFREAKKFMRLFNHKTADPNVLRMILVATKSVKDENEIASIRAEIKQKCVDAIGEIF
ncbi:MAG: hypothetical protein JWO44_959 [Bacteroidetes bacterium]|nr:hypothetical protein [Bacteroidota bacterium]